MVADAAREPDHAPCAARAPRGAAALNPSAPLAVAGQRYRGRFAPSPTGPLHAGSLVAALGTWLDARAHGGTWLVRIEDVDTPRCIDGAAEQILGQLAACGLVSDEAPLRQSTRGDAYAQALDRLLASGRAFACACSRREIELHGQAQGVDRSVDGERRYPGTCREGTRGRPTRAWRLCAEGVVTWRDRRLGDQAQDVGQAVGDFVLRRADGLWAYQLAVVVDDAAQGITDVVRGEDLADNTPRQILLQHALGLPSPRCLHLPLVRAADGRKLSKGHGAEALALGDPLPALRAAATALGLPRIDAATLGDWLARAVLAWAGIMSDFAPRSPR